MGISKEEIIDLATRYLSPEEITDFPSEGDLFCILARELPENKVLAEEEGWAFNGYGICVGYVIDEDTKPRGKWLWMHFASLNNFPPEGQVLKLQPPHVVKGRFQNPGRTHEFRILKVDLKASPQSPVNEITENNVNEKQESAETASQKIVQFRPKETKK
jgi:hypothetical protein